MDSLCPPQAVWYEIATGVMFADEAGLYLEHSASCVDCAAHLREAIADVKDEMSADESEALARLPSARREWQRSLVSRITGNAVQERRSFWRRWRMSLAATGLAAVAGIAWFVAIPNPLARTGQLLASAHAQKRTLQMKMDGMPYAPAGSGVQRRGERTFMDRPDTLLQAEAIIAKNLAKDPSNPRWLQAQGRADLMEGKYSGALEALRRANQITPNSPEILSDLAIASFELGDSATAYEKLSEALTMKPDDLTALFNRAIVSNELHLYHQVLEDSDRYLQMDPDSKWAEEVRELADRARLNLREQDRKQKISLLAPTQLLQAPAASRVGKIDESVEAYLKEAVRSWLPHAYPATASAADSEARRALFFLADVTRERHRDKWLSDLLHGENSPQFARAVRSLSEADRANDVGDFDNAERLASAAAEGFRHSNNRAGELRARFEQVFASQLSRESERCWKAAPVGVAAAKAYSYSWLEIQFRLEHAVCSGLMGDLGAYGNLAAEAQVEAAHADYGVLYLRCVTFAADAKMAIGVPAETIRFTGEGLQQFWRGTFPSLRGYSLYSILALVADTTNRPNLRYAAWAEAAPLNDSDPDTLHRAEAHRAFADAAISARRFDVAQAQYAEAGRLLGLAPSGKAIHRYILENEINTARLEARLGNFDSALGRLIRVRDEVPLMRVNSPSEQFYSTLGELDLRRHRLVEAQQSLQRALVLAKKSLVSISAQSDKASWSRTAEPTFLAMVQAQLESGLKQDSLATYEWFLSAVAGDQQIQSRAAPPELLINREEAVITYALLPGGLAIWVRDSNSLRAHWVRQSTFSLKDLTDRFLEMVSDPRSDMNAVRRDARSLYQAFIAPVEQELGVARTIVIETDASLALLPFEALLDGNGRYVLERWTIVHATGLPMGNRDSRAISSDSAALVVGSTASQPSLGILRLPNVEAEADAVSSEFRSATVLKGEDATLSQVRTELPHADVFHFAGHSLWTSGQAGLFLRGNPGSDSLVVLDTVALGRLDLAHLRLAVLSACSTASGYSGADGFSSVTDTFLRAGVPHIVASRWAVDSAATRSFSQYLYRNILSGQSVSESTRAAALTLMSDAHTVHPYYWSAFAAYGQP